MVVAREDQRLAARIAAVHAIPEVTGGSGLLRLGGRLLAVHDDAYRVTLISVPSLATTPLILQGAGDQLSKVEKPDFESAVQTPDGLVHLLGSGATANRCVIGRIDLTSGAWHIEQRPDLYDALRAALRQMPNIEGAVLDAERLLLFQRGSGGAPSGIVALHTDVLYGETPSVLDVRTVRLGTLDGVALAFTDAAMLAPDLVAYVASAEDAPDAVADGPIAGSVIGLLEHGQRTARWCRIRGAGAPRAKFEGLVIAARSAWVLADPDDSNQHAQLARLDLRGFG